MGKSAKHNGRLKREYLKKDKERYFIKQTNKDYLKPTRKPTIVNYDNYDEEFSRGKAHSEDQ